MSTAVVLVVVVVVVLTTAMMALAVFLGRADRRDDDG
jgi:hypothetical protein